jgi:hypothetical protein
MHIKEISKGYPRQRKELKITFPGGIVDITCGLFDREGREVTHVSVSADGDRYAGDPQHWAYWGDVSARGGGVRIIRHEHEKHGPGLCPICGHYGDDCTGKEPTK